MQLSEAIRLGAMLAPQCFQQAKVIDEFGNVLATCALGAAEQAGFDIDTLSEVEAAEGVRTACPACEYWAWTLGGMVAHLNDDHVWTREAIADWVATVEPADAAPPDDRCGGLPIEAPVLTLRG